MNTNKKNESLRTLVTIHTFPHLNPLLFQLKDHAVKINPLASLSFRVQAVNCFGVATHLFYNLALLGQLAKCLFHQNLVFHYCLLDQPPMSNPVE